MLATCVNSDGRSSTPMLAPSVEQHVDLLRRTYQKAGVPPSQVFYVEAHGTGTIKGDQTEVEALARVLGTGGGRSRTENGWCQSQLLQLCIRVIVTTLVSPRTGPLRIGTVKSNVGHTEVPYPLTNTAFAVLVQHPPFVRISPDNFSRAPQVSPVW